MSFGGLWCAEVDCGAQSAANATTPRFLYDENAKRNLTTSDGDNRGALYAGRVFRWTSRSRNAIARPGSNYPFKNERPPAAFSRHRCSKCLMDCARDRKKIIKPITRPLSARVLYYPLCENYFYEQKKRKKKGKKKSRTYFAPTEGR